MSGSSFPAEPAASAAGADPDSLWQRLRASPVQARLWLELALDYHHHGLPWQAAYAARQATRCDPELQPQLASLELEPDAGGGDSQLGLGTLAQAGTLIDRFTTRVSEVPSDWLTWLYLARLHELPSAGSPTAAPAAHAEALAQASRLEVIAGETLHWLGVWRLNAGDAEGAVRALASLVHRHRRRHGSLLSLGEALLRLGRVAAAEKAFSRASLSTNPDFLLTLATRVYSTSPAILHRIGSACSPCAQHRCRRPTSVIPIPLA